MATRLVANTVNGDEKSISTKVQLEKLRWESSRSNAKTLQVESAGDNMDSMIALAAAAIWFTIIICAWRIQNHITLSTNALARGIMEVVGMKTMTPQVAQQLFAYAVEQAKKGTSLSNTGPHGQIPGEVTSVQNRTMDWKGALASSFPEGEKWREHVQDNALAGSKVTLLSPHCGDMLRQRDGRQSDGRADKQD